MYTASAVFPIPRPDVLSPSAHIKPHLCLSSKDVLMPKNFSSKSSISFCLALIENILPFSVGSLESGLIIAPALGKGFFLRL